jgi:flagellar motor switch protein FliM
LIVADGGAQNDGLNGQGMGVLARKIARARGDVLPAPFDAAAGLGSGMDGDDLPPLGQAFGFAGADTAPSAQTDAQTRAWRMALARSARDQLKMTVGFSEVSARQASLTEVLETPMQRALIVMLQGTGEAMGLLVISGQMLAAMIEILTLMRLAPEGPAEDDLRKPTRTDAAMAVEFIDAVMAGFERVLAEGGTGADAWAQGYRYAAFIDDPRPLHLMLEECDYHLLAAQIALEDGGRRGDVTLALPVPAPALAFADFAAPLPDISFDDPPADDGAEFTAALGQKVQDLPVVINAAIAQIQLPLERLLRLQAGEVLPLPLAALDQIAVLGLDGQRIAGGRLGQNRGMRALRLTDLPKAASAPPVPAAQQPTPAVSIAPDSANVPAFALPSPEAEPNPFAAAQSDFPPNPDFAANFGADLNPEFGGDFPSLQTAV